MNKPKNLLQTESTTFNIKKVDPPPFFGDLDQKVVHFGVLEVFEMYFICRDVDRFIWKNGGYCSPSIRARLYAMQQKNYEDSKTQEFAEQVVSGFELHGAIISTCAVPMFRQLLSAHGISYRYYETESFIVVLSKDLFLVEECDNA